MTKPRDERGFLLITAMIVLLIILLLSLAMFAVVNVQSHQAGRETAGEAAFNLAESAMNAEVLQVQSSWPLTAPGMPTCNQASAQTAGCEGVALTGNFAPGYAGGQYTGATWSAQVLDDTGGASYYSESLLSSPVPYDSNRDNRLWIRAQATVNGQTRTVIEQVVRQQTVLTVPQDTIVAGAVFTGDDGSKTFIQAQDSQSGLTGNVEVRCGTSSTTPTQGQGNCLGWDAGKGQLSPPNAYGAGYSDPNGGSQTLSQPQLNALEQTAIMSNTVYNGVCPPDGTAGVVFVLATPAGGCSYAGTGVWNTAGSPGVFVVLNGTVSFSGTETFYGIVYDADQQGTPPPCTAAQLSAPPVGPGPVVTVTGNATVYGGVFVDQCGVVEVGQSKTNVIFTANDLSGMIATQNAMVAQDTFRQLGN